MRAVKEIAIPSIIVLVSVFIANSKLPRPEGRGIQRGLPF